MKRSGTIIFTLCFQLLSGCQAQPDFKAITASFNASRGSSVSKIELVPIHVGTSVLKLSKKVVIADSGTNSTIVGEIAFSEHPRLPKAMGHSGGVAACKMLIHFQDGTVFCFFVFFREGGAGAGVEYAINPDLNLNDAYENDLPGNHTLGRGYSIKLYEILQAVIKSAGESWIRDAR